MTGLFYDWNMPRILLQTCILQFSETVSHISTEGKTVPTQIGNLCSNFTPLQIGDINLLKETTQTGILCSNFTSLKIGDISKLKETAHEFFSSSSF